MEKYIAIICDIKNSKKSDDRSALQNKIFSIVSKINEEYQGQLKMNFTVTTGDEFQGLIGTPEKLFDIIHKLISYFGDVKLRFGVGLGNLITPIYDTKTSLGTDGPVWWNAREAINELKYMKSTRDSDYQLRIKGFERDDIEDFVNKSLILLFSTRARNNLNQKQLFNAIILNYGFTSDFTQASLAKVFDKGASNVSRTMKTMGYYEYYDTFTSIINIIRKEVIL